MVLNQHPNKIPGQYILAYPILYSGTFNLAFSKLNTGGIPLALPISTNSYNIFSVRIFSFFGRSYLCLDLTLFICPGSQEKALGQFLNVAPVSL